MLTSLTRAVAFAVTLFASLVRADDFATPPRWNSSDGGIRTISFALRAPRDVEVTIQCAGMVQRHLAGGLVGGAKSAAPWVMGLAQTLEWDGRDDLGAPVAEPGTCLAVVKGGLGAKLSATAGGDPWSLYSREMGQGDHAAWKLGGFDVKADGTVYLSANTNYYALPVVRHFTAAGEYLDTPFPPRGSLPEAEVRGWGVNRRPDGRWVPKVQSLDSLALTTTVMTARRGGSADLRPARRDDSLEVLSLATNQRLTFSRDGRLPDAGSSVPLVTTPALPDAALLYGPRFIAWAPDRSAFFLSGLFQADATLSAVQTTGFWRDGQVWKVDASGVATRFYALPESEVISNLADRATAIGTGRYNPYAAFHGVAVAADGSVLVADRQHAQVVVLTSAGRVDHTIPVSAPDALALDPHGTALYVTTLTGTFHAHGQLTLQRFADWRTSAPANQVLVLDADVGTYPWSSQLAVASDAEGPSIWVGHTQLPVQIYRDRGGALTLTKDFYRVPTAQRFLDVQHFTVDPRTERAFVTDGFGVSSVISDWSNPVLAPMMLDANTRVSAISAAVDPWRRFLFVHPDRKPVSRLSLDGPHFALAPLDGGAAITGPRTNTWNIWLGLGDRGMAVSRHGDLVTLNAAGTGPDYSGPLTFSVASDFAPWPEVPFTFWGSPDSAGARFDLRDNLYVGKRERRAGGPPGFEADSAFVDGTARIYRLAPTATFGSPFPVAPTATAQTFDVFMSPVPREFSRVPFFSVDGFGRIFYAAGLEARVALVDGAGNELLTFGTWGNRDESESDAGIAMAIPFSVDATDDAFFVSDPLNARVLRIEKTWAFTAIVPARDAGLTEVVDAGAMADGGAGASAPDHGVCGCTEGAGEAVVVVLALIGLVRMLRVRRAGLARVG